jgi:hypothetical protein
VWDLICPSSSSLVVSIFERRRRPTPPSASQQQQQKQRDDPGPRRAATTTPTPTTMSSSTAVATLPLVGPVSPEMAVAMVCAAMVLAFYPPSRKVIGYAGFVVKGMLEVADEYNSVYVDDVDRD